MSSKCIAWLCHSNTKPATVRLYITQHGHSVGVVQEKSLTNAVYRHGILLGWFNEFYEWLIHRTKAVPITRRSRPHSQIFPTTGGYVRRDVAFLANRLFFSYLPIARLCKLGAMLSFFSEHDREAYMSTLASVAVVRLRVVHQEGRTYAPTLSLYHFHGLEW